MATDCLAALRNAPKAFSVCSTAFSPISRTASGTWIAIFGSSISDFSIGVLRDVATLTALVVFEEDSTSCGLEASFDDFLLTVFFCGTCFLNRPDNAFSFRR